MEVIPHSQLASYIEKTITEVFRGVQSARNKGQPTYAVEQFTVDAVIVADDGLGALIAAQQTDETAPVVTTERQPERKQVSSNKRTTRGRTDGSQKANQTGTDKSTGTSSDATRDTSAETATSDAAQTDNATVDDTKQYGNEVRVQTTVES